MSKLYNQITGTTVGDNCPFCNRISSYSVIGIYAKDTFNNFRYTINRLKKMYVFS